MDEYEGFWIDDYGSGLEGYSGGDGDGWGDGEAYGFGVGYWSGYINGNGISNRVDDHREG